MSIVGKRLQFLREQANLTQEKIAACLKITQQTYSRYETGQIDLPLRHLEALSHYYHVSADYILGLSSIPRIPPELSTPFTAKITNREFLSYVQKFSPGSKKMLVDYIHYLKYLENQKAAETSAKE